MNEIMSSTAASYYSYQPQNFSPLDSETRPVQGAEVVRANQSNANESASNEKNPNANSNSSKEEQNSDEQAEQVLAQLQARDREVRAHEQAHLAAAGPYAKGGISYSYQTGSDGKSYAVGGSVSIDTSPIPDDPEATLQKARVVQQAALAPAEPSGQDMSVAAQASQMMQQAQQEIREEALKEQEEAKETSTSDKDTAVKANNLEQETTQNAASQDEKKSDDAESSNKVAQQNFQEANIPQRNEFELRVSLQALDT